MGKTILVVDDDAPTVNMLRDALEDEGYEVLDALDGGGLKIACARNPALILLDVNMPDMDGPEVARHLRANHATASIPIVAMSAGGIPGDMPADGHLDKPFALDDLFAALTRLLPGT